MTTAREKIRAGLGKLKQGLPPEAFAIVGDPQDPGIWKLLHTLEALIGG